MTLIEEISQTINSGRPKRTNDESQLIRPNLNEFRISKDLGNPLTTTNRKIDYPERFRSRQYRIGKVKQCLMLLQSANNICFLVTAIWRLCFCCWPPMLQSCCCCCSSTSCLFLLTDRIRVELSLQIVMIVVKVCSLGAKTLQRQKLDATTTAIALVSPLALQW